MTKDDIKGNMDNQITDQLMTIKDIANRLNCSTRTIKRYIKAGMPVLRIGGLIRIDYEEAINWGKKNGIK